MAINGVDISEAGDIVFRNHERLPFQYVTTRTVQRHRMGRVLVLVSVGTAAGDAMALKDQCVGMLDVDGPVRWDAGMLGCWDAGMLCVGPLGRWVFDVGAATWVGGIELTNTTRYDAPS